MDAIELTMRALKAILRDERAASAAEFVLVLPLLILLTIGTINLGLMMYVYSTLNFAVEDAARCASVKTTVCTDAGTLQAYAEARYRGPADGLTFALTTEACGSRVVGSVDYDFTTGLTSTTIPLSASACYPVYTG